MTFLAWVNVLVCGLVLLVQIIENKGPVWAVLTNALLFLFPLLYLLGY